MLFCCCTSKPAKDEDTYLPTPFYSNFLSQQQTSFPGPKGLNRILLEFTTEESKLGLKDCECLELIEQALLVASQNEISKKDLVSIFRSTQGIN